MPADIKIRHTPPPDAIMAAQYGSGAFMRHVLLMPLTRGTVLRLLMRDARARARGAMRANQRALAARCLQYAHGCWQRSRSSVSALTNVMLYALC